MNFEEIDLISPKKTNSIQIIAIQLSDFDLNFYGNKVSTPLAFPQKINFPENKIIELQKLPVKTEEIKLEVPYFRIVPCIRR